MDFSNDLLNPISVDRKSPTYFSISPRLTKTFTWAKFETFNWVESPSPRMYGNIECPHFFDNGQCYPNKYDFICQILE